MHVLGCANRDPDTGVDQMGCIFLPSIRAWWPDCEHHERVLCEQGVWKCDSCGNSKTIQKFKHWDKSNQYDWSEGRNRIIVLIEKWNLFTMELRRVDNDFSSKRHVHAKVEEEILLTSKNNKKCLVNLWSKLPFCYFHCLRWETLLWSFYRRVIYVLQTFFGTDFRQNMSLLCLPYDLVWS